MKCRKCGKTLVRKSDKDASGKPLPRDYPQFLYWDDAGLVNCHGFANTGSHEDLIRDLHHGAVAGRVFADAARDLRSLEVELR